MTTLPPFKISDRVEFSEKIAAALMRHFMECFPLRASIPYERIAESVGVSYKTFQSSDNFTPPQEPVFQTIGDQGSFRGFCTCVTELLVEEGYLVAYDKAVWRLTKKGLATMGRDIKLTPNS